MCYTQWDSYCRRFSMTPKKFDSKHVVYKAMFSEVFLQQLSRYKPKLETKLNRWQSSAQLCLRLRYKLREFFEVNLWLILEYLNFPCKNRNVWYHFQVGTNPFYSVENRPITKCELEV